MDKQVGKCSRCGGRVTVPTNWHATVPPVPTCQSCGARAKDTSPVIETEMPSYGDQLGTFGALNQALSEVPSDAFAPDVPEAPDFSGDGGDFGGGGASGDY